MVDISLKISRLRNEKGLKQSEMARQIGISQTAYAKIENGITKSISIDIGKNIARALGESFNNLFEIEDSSFRSHTQAISELEKENDKLKQDLDNYRTLIKMMKERNMIRPPKEKKEGENEFEPAGDDYLDNWLESLPAEEEKIKKEIETIPILREQLENGKIDNVRYREVYEKYFKK
ncbi:helix-turn-helix transcriptional regulator [Sunxiuqinia sp. A32]|uniref:helix-turn-helix transcriptional regulator n=1 Tax=Sunxiuqinia sp. A32 TaxID=3461496 RepID=UPI004045486E